MRKTVGKKIVANPKTQAAKNSQDVVDLVFGRDVENPNKYFLRVKAKEADLTLRDISKEDIEKLIDEMVRAMSERE
jgi:hypothetical protein